MAHATVLEQQQAGDEDDVSAGRLFGFVNIIAIFTSAATPRATEGVADALLSAVHRRCFKRLSDVWIVAHKCLAAARYSCVHNVCVRDVSGAADESVAELIESVRAQAGHGCTCDVTLYRVRDE